MAAHGTDAAQTQSGIIHFRALVCLGNRRDDYHGAKNDPRFRRFSAGALQGPVPGARESATRAACAKNAIAVGSSARRVMGARSRDLVRAPAHVPGGGYSSGAVEY